MIEGGHRTIPVKVTAWIDEGVAPLVSALNEFDRVMTVDSCEDDQGALANGAYVLFLFRGDSREGAAFACDLARALGESEQGYLLQAEWRAGNDEPLLVLSCPRESVSALAAALSAARTTLSAHDSFDTALRSSTDSPHRLPTLR